MSKKLMTVGSLFSGIGGIDLGMERTEHFRTLWFCERDPYCQRVLKKHWPEVPLYSDVNDVDEAVPCPDVLAGGFPCQPVSFAGNRKAQDDERWLWPHVERCIRILRPKGVLLENVPGLLTAGFDDVIGGLAACGYDAEWDCIPASALGAPHRRDRVFIIAAPRKVADASGESSDGSDDHAGERPQPEAVSESGNGGWPSPMANPDGKGADAVWPTEPNVGRVANGVPDRVDRLRAIGNAVVPQVAEYVAWRLINLIKEAA